MRHMVDVEELERHLSALCPTGPRAGLFGPGSETWRIAREAALFAGAWRAALLQLAHPAVAQAIADHSDTERDPAGRFRRTFRRIFTFIFGDLAQVTAAARALHQQHAGITGTVSASTRTAPAGVPYSANQREALAWVLYTLWDTALVAYDGLVEPLSEARRDAYVREGGAFARLFGLDPAQLPDTHARVRAEMDRRIALGDIQVTPVARRLAGYLFWPRPLWFKPLWSPLARVVTAHWMPTPLRVGFGLPKGGDTLARACLGMGRIGVRLLPGALRQVPPYHEAQARLRGDTRPRPWLRAMTRLWLGQPTLVR